MSNCPTETMVQPFATPWADTDSYFLAPSGSFESSLTGWTPSICVTTQTPDLRIFVLNTGSAGATRSRARSTSRGSR